MPFIRAGRLLRTFALTPGRLFGQEWLFGRAVIRSFTYLLNLTLWFRVLYTLRKIQRLTATREVKLQNGGPLFHSIHSCNILAKNGGHGSNPSPNIERAENSRVYKCHWSLLCKHFYDLDVLLQKKIVRHHVVIARMQCISTFQT